MTGNGHDRAHIRQSQHCHYWAMHSRYIGLVFRRHWAASTLTWLTALRTSIAPNMLRIPWQNTRETILPSRVFICITLPLTKQTLHNHKCGKCIFHIQIPASRVGGVYQNTGRAKMHYAICCTQNSTQTLLHEKNKWKFRHQPCRCQYKAGCLRRDKFGSISWVAMVPGIQ